MWKVYLKLDAWIISKVQDAYLWLLDRTGVYVATLTFGIYAVVGLSEIMDGGSTLWCGVLIALVGFSVAPRISDARQGREQQVQCHFDGDDIVEIEALYHHPYDLLKCYISNNAASLGGLG